MELTILTLQIKLDFKPAEYLEEYVNQMLLEFILTNTNGTKV